MKNLITALVPRNFLSLLGGGQRNFVRTLQNVGCFLGENYLVAALGSIGLKVRFRHGRLRQREVRSAGRLRKIWMSLHLPQGEGLITGFPPTTQERSAVTHTSTTFPRLESMHPDWFFRAHHSGWRFVSLQDREIRSARASGLVDVATYSFVRDELSQFLNVPSFELIGRRGKFREKLVSGTSCELLCVEARIRCLLSVAAQLLDHYRGNPRMFSCDFESNRKLASELNSLRILYDSQSDTSFPKNAKGFIPLLASHGDIAIQNLVLERSHVPTAQDARVERISHEPITCGIFVVDFENCAFRPFWADASALVLNLDRLGYSEESASKIFSEFVAPFGFVLRSDFSKHCRQNLTALKEMAESKTFELRAVRREPVLPAV